MDGGSDSPYIFATIMSDGQLEKLAVVSPSIDDTASYARVHPSLVKADK